MLNSVLSSVKAKAAEHRSFLLLMVFYILLSTFMLDNYPRVWVDEPWESITASTLAREGKMYNPVLENSNGFDKIFLQPRIVMDLVLAPVYGTFGTGPIQGRLASAACGALLMAGVYLFAGKIFSRRAALLATWFTMIETMMFIAYRTIRPEIYLVTLELFSLIFFFRGMESRQTKAFLLSGLFSGVALWTHPNAALHVIALTAILISVYRARTLTSPGVWGFAAGTLAGLLPYLLYVIVSDAQNSFATFFSQLGDRTGAVAQPHWFMTSLMGEWGRVLEYMRFPSRAAIVAIFIFAWIYSVISQKREARTIAVVVGLEALGSFLIISSKTVFYSTSVLPLLCILSAFVTDRWLGERRTPAQYFSGVFHPQHRRTLLAAILFAVLTLNQLGGDASLLWQQRNCSYRETLRLLQSAIPPGTRVWGSITFWFGFQHQPFRSQYTYMNDIYTFKPEYIITGDAETWGKDIWAPVRARAEEVITQRGLLIAELPQSCYGTLRVYHLQW